MLDQQENLFEKNRKWENCVFKHVLGVVDRVDNFERRDILLEFYFSFSGFF